MYAPDLIHAHLMDVALGGKADGLYNHAQMLRAKVYRGVLNYATHTVPDSDWIE